MGERELQGKVTAVCMSSEHGYPTYPQKSVSIGPLGIVGDAHSGSDRESFTNPGTRKPNDRPISIVSEEVYSQIRKEFGLTRASHGDFNEQIVVGGMGDLSNVEIGARVMLGGVVLEVTDSAWPCERLNKHLGEPLLAKSLVFNDENGIKRTKRGILTRVIEEGTLAPGEPAIIINPQLPTA